MKFKGPSAVRPGKPLALVWYGPYGPGAKPPMPAPALGIKGDRK